MTAPPATKLSPFFAILTQFKLAGLEIKLSELERLKFSIDDEAEME